MNKLLDVPSQRKLAFCFNNVKPSTRTVAGGRKKTINLISCLLFGILQNNSNILSEVAVSNVFIQVPKDLLKFNYISEKMVKAAISTLIVGRVDYRLNGSAESASLGLRTRSSSPHLCDLGRVS